MNSERGLTSAPTSPTMSSGELAKTAPFAAALPWLRLDADEMHEEKIGLVYLRLAYGGDDRSVGQDFRGRTGQDGSGAPSDVLVGLGPRKTGARRWSGRYQSGYRSAIGIGPRNGLRRFLTPICGLTVHGVFQDA